MAAEASRLLTTNVKSLSYVLMEIEGWQGRYSVTKPFPASTAEYPANSFQGIKIWNFPVAEPEGQTRISSGLDFEMSVTFCSFLGVQMLHRKCNIAADELSGRAGATHDTRVLFTWDLTLAFICPVSQLWGGAHALKRRIYSVKTLQVSKFGLCIFCTIMYNGLQVYGSKWSPREKS